VTSQGSEHFAKARPPVAETPRRPLISGNWKMHLNHFEAIQTVQKLAYLVPIQATDHVDVSVHPPFTDLRSIQTLIDADRLPFILGAQHCHWEDKGAFTGEVSPAFLAKLDVRYVICGHSERRELFGETDEMVAKKATAIQRHGMTPILCIGETLDEREAGATEEKVLGQLATGLSGRSKAQIAAMVIAYEPIWAIGTGRTATADDAQAVCAAIRARCGDLTDEATAQALRIQYGGSVKASNIAELMAQPDIDGALVGGASLDPDEFARIVQFA
jgi:triosephosphate isomerase (TIM)